MTITFRLDDSWHRPPDRSLVVAGSPVRMFRLTNAGIAVADALESGGELPNGHEPLTTRLRDAGAIHPVATTGVSPQEISVVVPTHVTTTSQSERLRDLVSVLRTHRVIVVDDASPFPVTLDVPGCDVIRFDSNRGPAAARNAGARLITTSYSAFIDDDVRTTSDDLCRIAAFCAEGAVLCAPRVRDSGATAEFPSRLALYEAENSPLDMGDRPARIAPLSRVSYVPSAALVVRTDAFNEVGGFDESLRIGEDVDFVWRLARHHSCRYETSVAAQHDTRRTVRSFIAQRFSYGSSAASLAIRHGSLVAPYSSNLLLVFTTTTAALNLFPAAALCVMMHLVYVTSSVTRAGDDLIHAFFLAVRGAAHAFRLFASAIVRAWLPIYAVLALLFPTLWWTLLVCMFVPAFIDWSRNRKMNPLTYLLLRVTDNVSYCAGTWWGAVRSRSFRCLAPRVTLSRARAR